MKNQPLAIEVGAQHRDFEVGDFVDLHGPTVWWKPWTWFRHRWGRIRVVVSEVDRRAGVIRVRKLEKS